MIRREADRYGVAVIESELIGLIPNEALVEAAKFYLQLDGLSSDQILENRLADLIQQR
jgi:glutamate formiminotransferase